MSFFSLTKQPLASQELENYLNMCSNRHFIVIIRRYWSKEDSCCYYLLLVNNFLHQVAKRFGTTDRASGDA